MKKVLKTNGFQESVMELSGIEPLTSWMPSARQSENIEIICTKIAYLNENIE